MQIQPTQRKGFPLQYTINPVYIKNCKILQFLFSKCKILLLQNMPSVFVMEDIFLTNSMETCLTVMYSHN